MDDKKVRRQKTKTYLNYLYYFKSLSRCQKSIELADTVVYRIKKARPQHAIMAEPGFKLHRVNPGII